MATAAWDGDYNFVAARGVAALVPRSAAIHPTGVIVNGLGVAGHFMVWEGQNEEAHKEPLRILAETCVPWSE
jgi:ATP adenylyltransferase/5',5'''-P-1,P-4-tetraphosphate phosphorylase II